MPDQPGLLTDPGIPPPIPGAQQQPGFMGGLLSGYNPAAAYSGNLADPATQQAFRQRALAAWSAALGQDAVTPYKSGLLGFARALGRAGEAGFEAEDQMQASRLQAAQALQAQTQVEYQRAAMQAAQQMSLLNQAFVGELTGGGGAGGAPGGAGGAPGGAGGPLKLPAAGKDPRGKIPVIRTAAIANGIDPDVAVAVAGSEGLATGYGPIGGKVADGGKSGGSFQLYTGGGMGNDFQKATGLNPLDPANEDATINYAMQRAARDGWGAWNGAKGLGITGFYGIGKPPAQAAGPSPAQATTAPGTPQPQPGLITGSQVKPYRAIGDSLAQGYVNHGGMQGDIGTDAVPGRTIGGTLEYIKSLPTGSLNGQPIMLSTGLSNSVMNGHAEEIGMIPEMLGELKRAGAGPISLMGVGTVAGQEKGMKAPINLAPYNQQLAQLAQQNGARFGGPLANTVVHPAIGYYTHAGRPPQEGAPPTEGVGPSTTPPGAQPSPSAGGGGGLLGAQAPAPRPAGLPPGAPPTALPQPAPMQAPGTGGLLNVPQAGAAMAAPGPAPPLAAPRPAPGGQGGLITGLPPQAPAPPPIPAPPTNLVPGRAAQQTVAAAGGPQPQIPPPTPQAPAPAPAVPPGPQGVPPGPVAAPAPTPAAQPAPVRPAASVAAPATMQPGGAGQIPGAPSQRAIQIANQIVALGSAWRIPVNPVTQKVAEFPLVGPTAAAQAQGQEMGALPGKLLFEQLKPQLLRQGMISVDPVNGTIRGNPGKVELTDAQGGKTTYFLGFGPDGNWMVQPIGQTEIGPGAKETLTGVAKTTVEQRDQVMKDAAAASVMGAQLRLIRGEAPTFYTGTFAEYRHDWDKLLVSMGLDPTDPRVQGVAGYESVNKQLGQLVREQAKATSQRAGVQELKLVGQQMPSVEMSPRGLDRTLAELQGLNDYRMAKMQAMSQWQSPSGVKGDTAGFEEAFNKQVSPYAFIVGRMSQQDRQELYQRIGQTQAGRAELQRLGQQIDYLHAQGLAPTD